MGCDIHMHTERLVEGQWTHVAAGPYDGRNYDLSWVLGEVRGHEKTHQPIGSYRGIPEDASEKVRTEHEDWGGDAHSATWLSLAELQRWIELHPDQRDIDESSFWTKALDYLRTIDERPEHVRIVFWFDN